MDKKKVKPDWCDYEDAALPGFGCWHLLNGKVKGRHSCRGCERFVPDAEKDKAIEKKAKKKEPHNPSLLDLMTTSGSWFCYGLVVGFALGALFVIGMISQR